jgi:hypothetical protein
MDYHVNDYICILCALHETIEVKSWSAILSETWLYSVFSRTGVSCFRLWLYLHLMYFNTILLRWKVHRGCFLRHVFLLLQLGCVLFFLQLIFLWLYLHLMWLNMKLLRWTVGWRCFLRHVFLLLQFGAPCCSYHATNTVTFMSYACICISCVLTLRWKTVHSLFSQNECARRFTCLWTMTKRVRVQKIAIISLDKDSLPNILHFPKKKTKGLQKKT